MRVIEIVVWHEKLGLSVDAILTDYVPTITRADIYAALAYYWDYQDEIEQAIVAERAWIEERRQDAPSLIAKHLASKQADAGHVPA